jgi:hypothetical protein
MSASALRRAAYGSHRRVVWDPDTLVFALFGIWCRRLNDGRRDARRRFP